MVSGLGRLPGPAGGAGWGITGLAYRLSLAPGLTRVIL